MTYEEAYYEEPTEGACSECGEEYPKCSLCDEDLAGEGTFLCDGEKHVCKECRDDLNGKKKKVKK